MDARYTDMLGVNTHIDFAYAGSPYLNMGNVIKAIKYLGVRHLRDAAGKPDSYKKWIDVFNATKARFCTYLPNGSIDFVTVAFSYWDAIYRAGLVNMFEAPNEPDKPYSIAAGNSIEWSAVFTAAHVAPWVKTRNKQLINLSVGAGWTAADGWKGNYDSIPNMSKICDFANAHVYPTAAQDVVKETNVIMGLAQLSMPNKPVMVTELGWDLRQGHTPDQIAADVVRIANANIASRIYFYSLFDDQSGKFGLFNDDATPRPAATAIRGLILSP